MGRDGGMRGSGGLAANSLADPGTVLRLRILKRSGFAGHALPRKVIVSEGGRTVSTISVDSLTELPSLSKDLFVPTEQMKARGPSVAMGSAQKISRFAGPVPLTPEIAVQPVCLFGLVTSSGQLIELHSLQPNDPDSTAALEDARKMSFPPQPPGGRPQQHFIFIIEKFPATEK